MIPFLIVKTRQGFSYIRPEHVLAIDANDSTSCTLVLSGGVTINSTEPAEDLVARMEAESRQQDEAIQTQEHTHGNVPRRD